jgi:hypothetical protein
LACTAQPRLQEIIVSMSIVVIMALLQTYNKDRLSSGLNSHPRLQDMVLLVVKVIKLIIPQTPKKID